MSSVELEKIKVIAQETNALEIDKTVGVSVGETSSVRIGIARDGAFGFYYPDDLEMLQSLGAELIYFDATKDPRLPELDGVFIGGGFPETHMAKLQANESLRDDIATRARAGLPIYAECGGLMYLTRSISWKGERFEMVGVIEADTIMHDRPQGRGLVELEETEHHPWALDDGAERGNGIAAHEFHYAALSNIDEGIRFAYRVKRGAGIDGVNDGIVYRNILASFTHLRNSSRSPWARRFIKFVVKRKQRNGKM